MEKYEIKWKKICFKGNKTNTFTAMKKIWLKLFIGCRHKMRDYARTSLSVMCNVMYVIYVCILFYLFYSCSSWQHDDNGNYIKNNSDSDWETDKLDIEAPSFGSFHSGLIRMWWATLIYTLVWVEWCLLSWHRRQEHCYWNVRNVIEFCLLNAMTNCPNSTNKDKEDERKADSDVVSTTIITLETQIQALRHNDNR